MSPPDTECSASRLLEPSRTRKSRRSTGTPSFQLPERTPTRRVCRGATTRWGGSAFDTDWGSGFDLVLLANFLHQLDQDGCVTLLRKARTSLVSGGRAVAVEFLLNEDRVSPRFSAMFAFQMLGSTPQGEAYTAREFEDMGRAAGFSSVIVKPLPPTPQSLILFEQA